MYYPEQDGPVIQLLISVTFHSNKYMLHCILLKTILLKTISGHPAVLDQFRVAEQILTEYCAKRIRSDKDRTDTSKVRF